MKSGNSHTAVIPTSSPDSQGRSKEGSEELMAEQLPTDKIETTQHERPPSKTSG